MSLLIEIQLKLKVLLPEVEVCWVVLLAVMVEEAWLEPRPGLVLPPSVHQHSV